ncbi:receptor kinase-like protein Xa21 [Lycium barbarum]|uniref:receptor kinase-like protein Xa21 n=1 Tax=Lycium barbarum TaxID=112863 RepID=UPI00293E409C|nr:receptor kinase-like protein Xa21 [Lycium barbarum]
MRRRKKGRSKDVEKVLEIRTYQLVSYPEIQRATNKFNGSNLIGVGSSGYVYKGALFGETMVAIKVLNLQDEELYKRFDTECGVMRNIRHRNLVTVITSCSSEHLRAIVLEYMPNESLDNLLHREECHLNLLKRVTIMLDVAIAIEYLHHGHDTPIVHCDLKPTNVLLDDAMVAHVGDFGISKILVVSNSMTHTKTLGTLGYIAPGRFFRHSKKPPFPIQPTTIYRVFDLLALKKEGGAGEREERGTKREWGDRRVGDREEWKGSGVGRQGKVGKMSDDREEKREREREQGWGWCAACRGRFFRHSKKPPFPIQPTTIYRVFDLLALKKEGGAGEREERGTKREWGDRRVGDREEWKGSGVGRQGKVGKMSDDREEKREREREQGWGWCAACREFGSEGIVSTKCDVYSYGIMLMEVLAKRRPTDKGIFNENLGLREWTRHAFSGTMMEFVDANLFHEEEQVNTKSEICIASVIELALDCTKEKPESRITTKDVVNRLSKINKTFLGT